MIKLIPAAGAGSRFAVEGYTNPKPLINVSGKPMIVQAANALPEADRSIFVCRKEHMQGSSLETVLKENFPGCEIITIDYLTEGQVNTCLLAEPYLDVDDSLTIGACDNSMTWNREKYEEITKKESVDALIWTFRNNVTVERNPNMYGWVKTDKENNALGVSCKVPISENPASDHAVVGSFYFRKSAYFLDAARRMIEKNSRTNNEFYVDVLMNEMIEAGLKVKVFEVDKYICWGTPNDLRTYEYWEQYFKKILKGQVS